MSSTIKMHTASSARLGNVISAYLFVWQKPFPFPNAIIICKVAVLYIYILLIDQKTIVVKFL